MSFLLRAFLVVAVLTYLASGQDAARLADTRPAGLFPATVAAAPAAWQTLPSTTRDRILREGAAGLAGRLAVAPSRDTLGEADRRLSWRGVSAP